MLLSQCTPSTQFILYTFNYCRGKSKITIRGVVIFFLNPLLQRVCTSRGEEGVASPLKLNLTDPCRTVRCQYHGWGMPGCRAGSPFAVYAWVQCREPKTGQKKVQFYCKDDWLWPSCYYLSMHYSYMYSTNNLRFWKVKICEIFPWV